MNNSSIKTTPTNKLIDILDIAIQNEEQDLVNIIAYEIATRLWVPNDKITLEQMAIDFGFKEQEQEEKGKTLSKRK